MNNFDTLFPNFLNQCAEMNRVLTPIAFVLLAIGIVSSTVTGHRSPGAYLRTIGRTFAFAAVLAYLPTWNNEIASVVDTTVKETLKADPAGVYAQYQKALQVTKGTSSSGSGSKSWWYLLDAKALLETAISAVMCVQGFLAGVLAFDASVLPKFMGLAALALWLISSTIAAPIIIQKAIATGTQVGQALFATTATAGVAGATAGVGAATTFGAAGGVSGFIAGTLAGGTAAIIG